MLKWANEHNIALTAYSPLGNPGFSWFASTGHSKTLEEPAVCIDNTGLLSLMLIISTLQQVLKAAEKYGKTPVQVLINWGVARGYCGKYMLYYA